MRRRQAVARSTLDRRLRRVALAGLFALAIAGAAKAWLVFQRAQELYADVQALTALLEGGLDVETIGQAGPLLAELRTDTTALRDEARPLLPVARLLGWVPTYGPLVVALGPLLDTAVELTVAADEGHRALAPLLGGPGFGQPLGPAIIGQITAEQPRLIRARAALAHALELWPRLPVEALPPPLHSPLVRVGTHLPDTLDGLDFLLALPSLLGADGPREYLLYAQNPDELRPTGGFISAAGTVVLDKGQVTGLALRDSGQLDDPGQFLYPYPPAALQRYMGFELWLLRDSNWSPDFPTAAQAGIDLYRLTQGRDVGGVVALNPAALRLILTATGPVNVDGLTVSDETVIAYIRKGAHGGAVDPERPWAVQRKSFLGPLSRAILSRLQEPSGLNLPLLARAVERALRERHLQVFLREPGAARLLARRGWDGGLRVGGHDFLMVADANLGYNKVNPHIRRTITYTVDLTDLSAPIADLRVRYSHLLQDAAPCDQARGFEVAVDITRYEDWMAGCYWNYSRVLSPRGTRLISATAHPTPGSWMISGEDQPGTVALLGEEAGASVMEAFFVVPSGEQREANFRYQLPPAAVTASAEGWSYRLLVQKQSGNDDTAVTVRVRLPPGQTLQAASPQARVDMAGGFVTFTLRLTHDQPIALTFR